MILNVYSLELLKFRTFAYDSVLYLKGFTCIFQETIIYEATGDGLALAYFSIDPAGQIYVIGNLLAAAPNVYNVSTHILFY